MREIILRTDIPSLREYSPGYKVRELSGHVIEGKPSAIVMFQPSIGEIIEEIRAIEKSGFDIVLAIIAEEYRRAFLEAVFPDANVLDGNNITIPMLFNHKNRRKIRFTDEEKRILHELAYGLSGKELSLRLGMSERSVRRMKEKLMRKTGLLSSGQLMLYALLEAELNTRSSLHILDKV